MREAELLQNLTNHVVQLSGAVLKLARGVQQLRQELEEWESDPQDADTKPH